jgi:hypothetical protein
MEPISGSAPAARGGTDLILCYWGMLESKSERLPTKTVFSWPWDSRAHPAPDEKPDG